MWDVSHHKIIDARRLAYWSWLIVETKETKGYSNTTAFYSLPRYFWPQKTEVKPEFSKRLDEVFPRSNRRYKLRFHGGSIAENAPILSSGTVYAVSISWQRYICIIGERVTTRYTILHWAILHFTYVTKLRGDLTRSQTGNFRRPVLHSNIDLFETFDHGKHKKEKKEKKEKHKHKSRHER